MIIRHFATASCLFLFFLFSLVKAQTLQLPKTKVIGFYLLFTLYFMASIFWSTNLGEAIFQASFVLMGFLVCIVIFGFLKNDLQTTKKVLWISAAIILMIYLLFAGIQLLHVQNTSFNQLYSVTGINGHKNLLSIMLFLLSAFLLTALPYINHKLLKVFPLALFAISITVIVILKSRAVILSIVTAAIVFGILYAIHSKKPSCTKQFKIITTLIAIALAFVFLTVLLRHLTSHPVPQTADKSEIEYSITSTSSLAERFLLWEKTYRLVDKHPLWGCGAGNWQIHFPDAGLKGLYRADVWDYNFTKPHNEYLGVLAESGYVGLFLFLTFLCSLIVFSGCVIVKTTDRKSFIFGAITLSIVCGCCFNALFDYPNSRVEHIVWIGILNAILFHFITSENGSKTIGWGWRILLLSMAALMVFVSMTRARGEHRAIKNYTKVISPFYTIDPSGTPMHWYQGKALQTLGDPQSINSFKEAYINAPFYKKNLNDLGLEAYYVAHDFEKAEFFLKEAIRISPNYLYPYLNLAYIYLKENQPEKAKELADKIYFDEYKCEVMKQDAVFFDPSNTEATIQKIDADYEAVLKLQAVIDSILKP